MSSAMKDYNFSGAKLEQKSKQSVTILTFFKEVKIHDMVQH